MLKIKIVLSIAAILVAASASVQAQTASNPPLAGGGLKEKYSANEIMALLADYNITSELAPYENNDAATIVATLPGGINIIVGMLLCDNPAAGEGCQAAVIYTGISNSGVAYEDINTFNTVSNVTRAINIAEQNLIIFNRQIFFTGGVGSNNFKVILELFLSDMQRYADSKAAGVAVSLPLTPQTPQSPLSKTDNLLSPQAPADVAAALPIQGMSTRALSAAIKNSIHGNYSVHGE